MPHSAKTYVTDLRKIESTRANIQSLRQHAVFKSSDTAMGLQVAHCRLVTPHVGIHIGKTIINHNEGELQDVKYDGKV